jgi:hypothetical protein
MPWHERAVYDTLQHLDIIWKIAAGWILLSVLVVIAHHLLRNHFIRRANEATTDIWGNGDE